ncbi:hypothetical protein ACFX11_012325 [Malus domestica]
MKEDLTLVNSFALEKSMHIRTRLDEQTRRLSSLGKSRQWLKRRKTESSPAKILSSWIIPNTVHSTEVPVIQQTTAALGKNYLEKLMKEGKVDRYLDKPAVQRRRNADDDEEPPTKTIWINGIFIKSDHLGATNNSKKREIQQTLLVSQVQAVDTQHGYIIGFIE